MATRICVAQIGGAHGLRGEVKLKAFTADPMAIKDYAPLENEDGTASFVIETLRPGRGHLVARLRGIGDREAAQRLAQVKLFVARERLPAAGPDEFYHVDLIGLSAVTGEGDQVGTVVALHDFGAGDIIELKLARTGASLMLPFTEEFVPRVDIPGRRIVIVPPQEPAL
jgi:16S rRNA processing protein RimM